MIYFLKSLFIYHFHDIQLVWIAVLQLEVDQDEGVRVGVDRCLCYIGTHIHTHTLKIDKYSNSSELPISPAMTPCNHQ